MSEQYVCTKCGQKFWEEPTSHGVVYMSIYPSKPKPMKECNGKVVKVEVMSDG